MSPQSWVQEDLRNDHFTRIGVVIIGGGISGICTAIDLIKKNIRNFVIIEKGGGPGGTWRDNKYPGCRCDVMSHLYSLSFAPNPDWSRDFAGQEEILDYLLGVVEKYGLFKHIRFNSIVEEACWSNEESKWITRVQVTGGKDSEFADKYTITSDFLVSCVGLKDFQKKTMHSARWDWTYDIRGKKVIVIGNGATAVQIVPEVAKVASHLTVVQRSPNWLVPRGDQATPEYLKKIYRYIPGFRQRHRDNLMNVRESFHTFLVDPESQSTKDFQNFSRDMLKSQLLGRPDLLKKLTPDYPMGCKRILLTDEYLPALCQENVSLETRRLKEFTPNGILVEGEELECDLIIFATGFRTVDFMHPIKVTGINQRPLSEDWKDGARALYGVAVENLPNFGMLYGPNTNLGHNSIILMLEAQSQYITTLVKRVLDLRSQGKYIQVLPRAEKVQHFNEELQDALSKTAFSHPGCNSWFKTSAGLVTNNWPGTVIEYQSLLSKVDWNDYEIIDETAGASHLHAAEVESLNQEAKVSYKAMALTVLSVLAVAGLLRDGERLLRLR